MRYITEKQAYAVLGEPFFYYICRWSDDVI